LVSQEDVTRANQGFSFVTAPRRPVKSFVVIVAAVCSSSKLKPSFRRPVTAASKQKAVKEHAGVLS